MKHLLLLLFLVSNLIACSQDGKIIDQQSYTIADSILTRVENSIPGSRAAATKVNFSRITYMSDGLKIKGYLGIPKEAGKYPCIIFNRGGSREFSTVTDEVFLRLLGKLAASGYVVVATQYRNAAGGEGVEEFGGKDIDDVMNLIPLLASLPQADTSRIGMFGWSRGGMMTYLALAKTTKIKAAVVAAGLADLTMGIASRPAFDTIWAKVIPGYTTNKQKVLDERSATKFAEKMNKNTPILILQGTGDWRVPTDQVLVLVSTLYQVKHPFRFILYEGGQHSLVEHRPDYTVQIESWFNNYLRDGKKWPSLEPHGE